MELSSTHPKIIGQLLEVLRENLSDVLFHFHPDSIKLRSADSAKTFIVYVNLVNFEKYECKKYLPVGINIGKLWTVVKLAHPEDILQMECKADGEHLQIYIKDSKTNQIRFETRYITYECDEDALEIPESINFETCISMNSNEFYSNLKNLENLEAEFVKLCQCTTPTGENRLRLIGIGSPSHKEPKFDIDEVAKPSTANSIKRGKLPELSFVFPLKKLVQFAKAHCLDPDVRIHLSEKGYLVLQYSIKVCTFAVKGPLAGAKVQSKLNYFLYVFSLLCFCLIRFMVT